MPQRYVLGPLLFPTNMKDIFRTGPFNSFSDLVFQNEINLKIKESDEFYSKMLFKEALRTGVFEFQAARDTYREISLDGMHIDLVMRFIEVQTKIMAPICPHVAEHVWELIGNVRKYILNVFFYYLKDVFRKLLLLTVHGQWQVPLTKSKVKLQST